MELALSLFAIYILVQQGVLAQDNTMYSSISSLARLPCDASHSGTPNGIAWYVTEITSAANEIFIHISGATFTGTAYIEGKYEYNENDNSLTVKDVQHADEMKYTCTLAFTGIPTQTIINMLIVLVPPTEVSLILPVFQATIPTSSTQCHIPAVKPGIGSVVFRLSIGSDFSVDSSNSDLKSGAPDANTGTVSVTYSPEIMLQRKHNGQQAVCTVVWREETVTSESKNADVRFLASTVFITKSPTGAVSENTDVTFMCVTDEAKPTADVVWSVDGTIRSSDSDFTEDGMYNTQKRRSVLTVRVDRTLHNKEVECHVSGKSAVRDSITVDITFPHNVHIFKNPSDTVLQGVSMTLTCEATGGNPVDVLSYNWSFEPRYEVSSALSNNTDRELEFNNVQYTQAGVYRCEVDNGAAVGTSKTEILVQFSPIDVSSHIQKVSYSPLKQDATLNCTVRANPVVTKDGVTVRHNGYVIESNQVNVQLVERKTDETVVELSFQPVEIVDYGMYEVIASNKVGQQTLQLRLVENGVPEAPHSVVLQSITAISVTLSWLPGRSGGSTQTFTVYYRKDGESKILYQHGIEAIEEDELITYKVSGLDPQTKYNFKVQATNSCGESIFSLEVPSYTLAIPELKDAPRLIVYDDIRVLQWQTVVGIYNFTVIVECMSVCTTILNYTENSHKSFVLSGDYLGKSYFITVYQSEDEVLRQKFTVEDKRGSDEQDVGLVAGIAVTSVVAGLLAMTLIIFYISLKSGKCNKCFRKEHIKGNDETPVASYENAVTKQDAGHYELTQSGESQLPAEYTDLKHITYEVVG